MEESDLRRSPSLERLMRRRPSFSRPPIRTVYSPTLTEDEAEMLTSPFLSYRTKYTYAQSSCYDPDLPCSWEVPNLSYAGTEINAPLSNVHVSSPSIVYVLWSYILWIFELVAYFIRKIFVTFFKEGPIKFLVLLYDITCTIFYGFRSALRSTFSLFQSFFFGNALHREYSPFHVLGKTGRFLFSLLLLPITAAHWLLDKTGKGVYSAWNKMSSHRYNLRRSRAAPEEHVRFSPQIDVSDIHDDEVDRESHYSIRTRSSRPVHNLRSRMITQVMTDSEDEGFSEKRPAQMTSTPIRSALKNGVRRRLDFEGSPSPTPSSKSVKTAQLLGSAASTVVSGVYWVLIGILTCVNRCYFAYKHRVKYMFSGSPRDRDVNIMHTRRSTRRKTSSSDSSDDQIDHVHHRRHRGHHQTWSSKFVTTILYPLAVAYNAISNVLYWILKASVAIVFAFIDVIRFIKNMLVNGLYNVVAGVRTLLFGGRDLSVFEHDGVVEEMTVHPYAGLSKETEKVLYYPYSVLNYVGMKTMDGLTALGNKKRLLLWLLPLLLLLLVLWGQNDDQSVPLKIRKNVDDIKNTVREKAEQTWSTVDPEGKLGYVVHEYYSKAQDTVHQAKDGILGLGRSGFSGVWSALNGVPSRLWNWTTSFNGAVRDFFGSLFYGMWDSVRGGPEGVKNGIIYGLTKVKNEVAYLFSGIWSLISSLFGVVRDLFGNLLYGIRDSVRGGPEGLKNGIVYGLTKVKNGVAYLFNGVWNLISYVFGMGSEGFKSFFTGIWNVFKYFFLSIWNIIKGAQRSVYNFVMWTWNKIVDFLVFGIDVCRSTSRKVSSFWNQNMSLPSTEKIKDTAYEYYEQVSTADLPSLNILPDLPEIPVQLKPSYYSEYVPTKGTMSNVFWNVINLPIAAFHYIMPSESTKVVVKPPLGKVPTPRFLPNEEAIGADKGVVYHPEPHVHMPTVNEAKIVKDILAKLAPTLPMVDEAKIIQEILSKMLTPKIDESKIIEEVSNKLKTEMELKMKLLEESYKKNIEEINVKHSNIEIDYSRLETLIRKAIYQYDADKTGLFDYALESAGAAVISTRCSESYNSYSRLEKIWNIPLWYSSYGPRTVIQRNSNSLFPGECWSFKSGQGYLTIDLSHQINITSISYEHIGADQAPDNNRSSAPKTFKFWAYKTEDDIRGRFLLGEFEYKLDGHPLQFFVISRQPDWPVKIVEMEVTSNYGAEFTCLYRLRVHGQLFKTV